MNMEVRRVALDKLHKRRDRIEMPDFQREPVWSNEKKQLLMDSILRGWHLPKLYFRKIDKTTSECVDGQQRLTAIWEFYDGSLQLSPDTAKVFGGASYKDLPDDVVDDLDDFELEIEEIEEVSDEELEVLFQRLQLGTPLNTPERLNAIGGDMRDFVKKTVSKHAFFANRIAVKDTRFSHFDIAAKWVFVEARGVQPQMRFLQLESLFKDYRSLSESSELAKRVKTALKYLEQALPEKCQWLRNRANVLSVCMLASLVVNQKLDKSTAARFGEFISAYFEELAREIEKGTQSTQRELLEYQQAINSGSTGGDSLRTRLTILVKRLAMFDPVFSGLMKAGSPYPYDTDKDVAEEAATVRHLITVANERHAALKGEDIFKMTNASVAALTQLGVPCRTEEQYGQLIDALYKLIYEGSGSAARLPDPPPEFSMEVKHLRIGLRHDVDHGGATKVAKKRIEVGGIFQKYSGRAIPAECTTEDFLVVHLRLLTSARRMLEALLTTGAAENVAPSESSS